MTTSYREPHRAVLIAPDGTETPVVPADGARAFSLAELQGHVGGLIEIARTHTGKCLVINEEGKLKGFPVNRKATLLYRYGYVDPIVGPAVLCTAAQIGIGEEDEQP